MSLQKTIQALRRSYTFARALLNGVIVDACEYCFTFLIIPARGKLRIKDRN